MSVEIVGELIVYVNLVGTLDDFRYDAIKATVGRTDKNGELFIENALYKGKLTNLCFAPGVWKFFTLSENRNTPAPEASEIEALEPHAASVDMLHDIKPARDNGSDNAA